MKNIFYFVILLLLAVSSASADTDQEDLLQQLLEAGNKAKSEELSDMIEESNHFWLAGYPAKPTSEKFLALKLDPQTIAEIRVVDVTAVDKRKDGIWRVRIAHNTKFFVLTRNLVSPGRRLMKSGATQSQFVPIMIDPYPQDVLPGDTGDIEDGGGRSGGQSRGSPPDYPPDFSGPAQEWCYVTGESKCVGSLLLCEYRCIICPNDPRWGEDYAWCHWVTGWGKCGCCDPGPDSDQETGWGDMSPGGGDSVWKWDPDYYLPPENIGP
jgi:hypothetical protein